MVSLCRYQFSIKVVRGPQKLGPVNNVKTVEVSILGASPPLVYIPMKNSASSGGTQVNVVNPDDGATLTGVVQGMKAGCHISWASIDMPGYITLNYSLVSY